MKNNLYRKGFIVPVLLGVIAILIIGGGVYLYKNKKVEAPIVVNESEDVGLDNQQEVAPVNETVKDKSIKTFKLGNLEFSYPEILTLEKKDNGIWLSHSIAQKHQNRCDFVGDAPTLDRINDVGIGFELTNKDVFNSVKTLLGDDTAKTLLKNNSITIDPGFIDRYKIGNLDGYKIYRGIEACGGYNYYFPISANQTLSVYRSLSSQTVGQTSDAYMLKLPGIISFEKEEQIFKDILSSVKGLENKETMSIKLYFGNRIYNPEMLDCRLVYPVTRIIPYTQSVATATLNELIKGPTTEEGKKGYFSSIPDGTKVNSVKMLGDTLYIDFNEVAAGGGGSCGQALKGNSINTTLRQFSTIKNIEMTINGKGETADLFQP